MGTETGALLVLDRSGRTLLEHQIASPGNVVINGTDYGSVAPGQLEIQWSPDSTLLIAQHGLSGERWVCRRASWSCSAVEQFPMQGIVRFPENSSGFYDRWTDQDRDRAQIRRFSLPDATLEWSWSDGRIQSSIVALSPGGGRVVAATDGGRLVVVDER